MVSLSLAYIRYYGDSVRSEGFVNSGLSRILVDDIWQIVLGLLFALLGTEGADVKEAAS